MWTNLKVTVLMCFAVFFTASIAVHAQDPAPPPVDDQPVQEEDSPVSGGVTYQPAADSGEGSRDPFKSPFELEQEEREAQAQDTTVDDEDRLVYNIGELDLKGIYLQNGRYWAIFRIGDDYDWFQEGVKFRDGDLVNITDGAVVFHHFPTDDPTQIREVIKELHRGEE